MQHQELGAGAASELAGHGHRSSRLVGVVHRQKDTSQRPHVRILGPMGMFTLRPVVTQAPTSIDEIIERLTERRYIVDRGLATSIFLALRLGKPLFIEGEAGVGKTEAAKVMADVLGARLIRLQCYSTSGS